MGRHEQREQLFCLLFREEFHPADEMPEQLRLFLENTDALLQKEDAEYISRRFEQIQRKLPELDELIEDYTEGWSLDRLGKVELAVLRLGCFEICFDEEIPDSVAINEAVEIAKTYGQENSGGFVNAILGKIVKLGDQDS